MDYTNTLGKTSNFMDPIEFTYTIEPRNWFEKMLVQCGISPQERTFTLQNLSAGNVQRIALIAAEVLPGSLDTNGPDAGRNVNVFLDQHIDKLIYVVAVGIVNSRQEPKPGLLSELKWNVEREMVEKLALAVFSRSGIAGFPVVMAGICGLDILSDKKTIKHHPEATADLSE